MIVRKVKIAMNTLRTCLKEQGLKNVRFRWQAYKRIEQAAMDECRITSLDVHLFLPMHNNGMNGVEGISMTKVIYVIYLLLHGVK